MPSQTPDRFGLTLGYVFERRVFYPLVFAFVLALALLPYYIGGTLILGGEGDVVLDFSIHLKMFQDQWYSRYGFGWPNLSPGANGVNALFHILVERLSANQAATNFLVVFPMYYIPFLGMYLLATQVGARPHLAFLVSLFYVFNPFYSLWVISLNEWNVYSGAVLPLFFWVIFKYYHDNLKLFLFYGLITACFSFAYTNPPLNAIINIASILSVYIASYYYNGKFSPLEVIKKYLLVFTAFFLFNSWWLLNLFYTAGYARNLYLNSNFSVEGWLFDTVSAVGAPLAKAFSMTQIVNGANWDFFGYLYHTPIGVVLTLVPILLVVGVFPFMKKTALYKLNLNIFILCLIVFFLIKGAAQPFGGVYLFLFKNIPFFNIFKTPVEKFGLLYTFLFTVLLLFVLHGCCEDRRVYRKAILVFAGYLLFCFIPVLTGNIIPDSNFGIAVGGRKFADKQEYRSVREDINKDRLDYRVLSLPGMGNYQILMDNFNGKKYSGLDPIINNVNKDYIASHSENEKVIYHNLAESPGDLLLSLFGIGKMVVNEGFIPWFGIVGPDADNLRHKFRALPRKEFGGITVFDNTGNFVPHLYAPSSYWVTESRK